MNQEEIERNVSRMAMILSINKNTRGALLGEDFRNVVKQIRDYRMSQKYNYCIDRIIEYCAGGYYWPPLLSEKAICEEELGRSEDAFNDWKALALIIEGVMARFDGVQSLPRGFTCRDHGHAYYEMGLLKSDEPNEALEYFDKAVQIDNLYEKDYVLYSRRGDANYRLENFDDALSDYTKALELAKGGGGETLSRLHYKIARIEVTKNNHERAISNLNATIEFAWDDDLRNQAEKLKAECLSKTK